MEVLLSRIILYPVKSLDGVAVNSAKITPCGILEFDRVYAIVDEAGSYINGKRTPLVHQLRASYDDSFNEICVWTQNDSTKRSFLLREPGPLNKWLSDFFGFPVKLISEMKSGFPDDRTAFGPTIVSEASLRSVTEWFPSMTMESARRRFRSNLEVTGVAAFWEDHLFGNAGELKPFLVGNVKFLGHNPCQRCVVPTRDPDKAEPIPNFQKSFMELRRKNLPAWSNPDRFNHYYRFAINTSIPDSEAGKLIGIGHPVQIKAV